MELQLGLVWNFFNLDMEQLANAASPRLSIATVT